VGLSVGQRKFLPRPGRPPKYSPVATTPATRRGRSRPKRLPGESIVAIKCDTPAQTPTGRPNAQPSPAPKVATAAQRPQRRCLGRRRRPRSRPQRKRPQRRCLGPRRRPRLRPPAQRLAATMRQALAAAQGRDQPRTRTYTLVGSPFRGTCKLLHDRRRRLARASELRAGRPHGSMMAWLARLRRSVCRRSWRRRPRRWRASEASA
jgi:hypothetical protein